MKNINNNLSFPRFVVGNLPLSTLLLKKDKQLYFNRKVEDPRQKPSGMTSPCNNDHSGFTLIELLVVVLIIGILASIAVPKYQKAVEKSRGVQAITLLKSLGQAQAAYYLANETYANTFDELPVEIPLTGETPWRTVDKNITDTRSNQDWSFQIWQNSKQLILMAGRLTGDYKGGGFLYYLSNNDLLDGKLRCGERKTAGIVLEGEAGRYCTQLFHGNLSAEDGNLREYNLP